MDGDGLLTTAELAKYLRIRCETIVRKARKGELPSIKIGRQFRFDKSQVKHWIDKHRIGEVPHVLVADDNPQIGELFRKSLEEIRIEVTTVLNSGEAINLITKGHFDLVFIDLKLSVADGNELFTRIREMSRELPIIIITENHDSDLMEKALRHGPFMVLKKPFGQKEILSAVRFLAKDTVSVDSIE